MTNDKAIEAAARSDAEFDGKDWPTMGRVNRERYMERCRAALAALKAGDVLPGGFVVRREDDPIREHEGKFLSEGAILAEYAAKPQRIEATWAEMERRLLDQIKPYLRRSREPYDFGGGMKGVRLETWTRVFPPFPATKEPPHD